MPTRDDLLQLASRCEAASGPDRRLDGAIYCAIQGLEFVRVESAPAVLSTFLIFRQPDGQEHDTDRWAPYTASLDAALSLAQPPSPLWTWTVNGRESPSHPMYFAEITKPSSEYQGRGRTPALALCSAALRARALA